MQEGLTVLRYERGLFPILYSKVIPTTSNRRSGIRCHASFVINYSTRHGESYKSCTRHVLGDNKMKKIWLPVVMFIVGGLVGALIIHLVEQKKFEITRTQLLEATDAFILYRHGYIKTVDALKDCILMIPDACFRMTESIDDFATVKKRIDRYESE